MLAFGGAVVMLQGLHFNFVRSPLLPEDLRAMATKLAQVEAAVPDLAGWLRGVFWVIGSRAQSDCALQFRVLPWMGVPEAQLV